MDLRMATFYPKVVPKAGREGGWREGGSGPLHGDFLSQDCSQGREGGSGPPHGDFLSQACSRGREGERQGGRQWTSLGQLFIPRLFQKQGREGGSGPPHGDFLSQGGGGRLWKQHTSQSICNQSRKAQRALQVLPAETLVDGLPPASSDLSSIASL